MAYFSNGSEGEWFEEAICGPCPIHEMCPVLAIHYLYNSDQLGAGQEQLRGALNMLVSEERHVCAVKKASIDNMLKLTPMLDDAFRRADAELKARATRIAELERKLEEA